MTWRCIVGKHMLRVEAEDADIILAVKHNKLVGAELDVSYGGSSWRIECRTYSFLAKDIDYTRTELRFIGAHCEERLNRVIRKD